MSFWNSIVHHLSPYTFGFLLFACGCSPQKHSPEEDFKLLHPLYSAYNDASIQVVSQLEALKDLPQNERNAKSLQAMYATLSPALATVAADPPDVDGQLKDNLLRWDRIASKLHSELTQIVKSEQYGVLDDPHCRVNQLLRDEDEVSVKITSYLSGD